MSSVQSATVFSTYPVTPLGNHTQNESMKLYKEALENLRKHLTDLSNPILAAEVFAVFAQIADEGLDYLGKCVIGFFSDLSIPDETRKQIAHYDACIKKILEMRETVDEVFVSLINDLKELAKIKQENEYVLWDQLKLFFSLPQIKKLENCHINKMIHCIQHGLIDEFKERTIYLLKEMKEENAVSEALKKTPYKNLPTLLAQIIKTKPKKDEGIFAYWDSSDDFFKNKGISIINSTGESKTGEIKRSYLKGISRVFCLHDNSEIHVNSIGSVDIIEKSKYHLWTAISNDTLKNKEFEIEVKIDKKLDVMIAPGIYRIGETSKNTSKLKLGDHYIKIELINTIREDIGYTLYAYFKSESSSILNIEIQGKGVNKISHIPQEFNRIYFACIAESRTIDFNNRLEANKNIQIKDEKDESKVRRTHLNENIRQLEELSNELLLPENKQFLDSLIDNQVTNQLNKVNLELVKNQKPNFAAILIEISERYKTHLNVDSNPEDLLKQMVEEVNYVRLIDKDKIKIVTRTMNLLKEANEHIQKISGNDLILVMGNTGSGKSTAVSYFLDAEMGYFYNRVGDKVIHITNVANAQKNAYPTIGQSLGEAETLYTQGYQIPDSSTLIGDCPGFQENRGGNYELCTNLSIDQSVLRASTIRSIVVVVPIHAFLVDRSNPIIDLVGTIKERFPNTFGPNDEENSAIYLLITKSSQALPKPVEAIKDGTRVKELLIETQNSMKKVMDNYRAGGVIDDFHLEALQNREVIWSVISKMHEKGQVDFIDIEDCFEKEVLLTKYKDMSKKVNKAQYVPAMLGDMHAKFGKCIEMSTGTWVNHIITPYLKKLPDQIVIVENEIEDKKAKLNQLKDQLIEEQEKIKRLHSQKMTLESSLIEIRKAKNNPSLLDGDLQQKLAQRIADTKNAQLKENENALILIETEITSNNRQIDILKKTSSLLEFQIERTETTIASLNEEVRGLSEKSTTIELWKLSYKPDDLITLQYYKAGARDDGFVQMRPLNPEEIERTEQVRAKNYKGNMVHTAIIEKEYRLVSSDPVLRAQFERDGVGGKYKAEVTGTRFESDLGRKASPTGKKVAHGFKTQWDGTVIPEIKISYTIPNIDYNEPTIINKEGLIKSQKKDLADFRSRLEGGVLADGQEKVKGKKQELKEAENNKKRLEKEANKVNAAIEKLKMDVAVEQVGAMLKYEEESLEGVTKQIQSLEGSTRLSDLIAGQEKEIQIHMKERVRLIKEKKHLAIVIQTQFETARQLRDFCNLVVVNKGNSKKERIETITSCEQFMEVYDANHQRLIEESKKELQLASTHARSSETPKRATNIHTTLGNQNVADIL